MRKIIFLACMIIQILLYAESDSSFVPVESPHYAVLRTLFLEAGQNNYSRSYPYSRKEFRETLERLNVSRLSSGSQRKLESLRSTFSKKDPKKMDFNADIEASAEAYGNINDAYTDFTKANDPFDSIDDRLFHTTDANWKYGSNKRKPFLGIHLQLDSLDYVTSVFQFDAQKDPYQTGIDNRNFTNVITASSQADLMTPYRAYVGGGFGNIYLQWGRDQLEWGNGEYENFILSSEPAYYDFFRFSAFWDKYKFSFVDVGLETWLLEHDIEYAADGTSRTDMDGGYTVDEVFDAVTSYFGDGKYFLGHKMEGYPLDNLYVSLSESIIFAGPELSWNYLNPVMLYHNYYITGYANSIVTLESAFAPMPGLNLYGQIAVDQFETPWEQGSGPSADAEPGAMGYLIGIQTAPKLFDSVSVLGYECAFSSPYLYYGSHYKHDELYGGNSPYLAITSRRRIHSESDPVRGKSYLDQSMGISTGPDSFIQNMYWKADITDTVRGVFRVHYLMKGERYITTPFTSQGAGSAVTPTGTVWHDLSLQTDLEWKFHRDFSAFLHMSYIRFWNLHHIEGNDGYDLQAGIGITYKVY